MEMAKEILAVWLPVFLFCNSFVGKVSGYDACNKKIGLDDQTIIRDSDFSASSSYRQNLPFNARIKSDNGTNAWCFQSNDTNPYLKVQLPATYKITAISMQGRNGAGKGMYVSSFEMETEYQEVIFPYGHALSGNIDKAGIKRISLFLGTYGYAVTIKPKTWYPANIGCLKLELYGCKVEERPTVVPTTVTINHCLTNKGGCQHQCQSTDAGAVCSCNRGYKLNSDNKTCTDINECQSSKICDPQTTFCRNIAGGYECLCKNSSMVIDSKNKTRCVDFDECSINNGNCDQHCHNLKNGHRCSCSDGFHLKRDGRTCTDIDECAVSNGNCEHRCNNQIGSYNCVCNRGYRLKSDKKSCEDVDECRINNGNCQHRCHNKKGYRTCSCYNGFRLQQDNKTCADIDECRLYKPCDNTTSRCKNSIGSFKCKCFPGLRNDPIDRTKCININECRENTHGCEHECTDTYRSYYCSCQEGYHLAKDQHSCLDNNECTLNNGNCSQICVNFYGGHRCDCKNGFRLVNYKRCDDIDECSEGKDGCDHICNNTIGSFECLCNKGFRPLGKHCFDVNECITGQNNCNTTTEDCYNTHGSFECRCKREYKRDPVTKQCIARTCSSSVIPTNGYVTPSQCRSDNKNVAGSMCNFHCNTGYKLSKDSSRFAYCSNNWHWVMSKSNPLCEPVRCGGLTAVKNGFLRPSECATVGAQNTMSCQMDCFNGYNYVGTRSVQCQANGTYSGDFRNGKCIPVTKISCPADIVATLPLGRSKMSIEIGAFSSNVPREKIQSKPAGVLDGSYKFPNDITIVMLTATNEAGITDSCSFSVKVVDKEAPKVSNCDASEQYVTINGEKGIVRWSEPTFSDNSGSVKVHVNLENGKMRQTHTYYVDYTARDASGNTNHCRFFVVVQAKYCNADQMPGGYGAKKQTIPIAGSLMVFLSCEADKTFSHNFTGYVAMVRCSGAGQWSDASVPSCVGYLPSATRCPSGTQKVKKSPSTVSIKEVVCAKCGSGSYQNNGRSCEKCAKGYYQDSEGQSSCKKCPKGSTTIFKGATSILQCKALCEQGSYSVDGLKSLSGCIKCPIGTFQDVDGQKSCKRCPQGGMTSSDGATQQKDCYVPARIAKIVPVDQTFNAFVGDNLVVECTAYGVPFPYVSIVNSTVLAPDSFRGQNIVESITSSSPYVSKIRMTIKNAQVQDTATYKCIARNQAGLHSSIDERKIDISVKQRT